MAGRVALAAAWTSVLIVAGCATRPASNPFIIRNGHGSVDVGKAPAVSKPDHNRTQRAMREALAKRASEQPESLPSIERSDKQLRESLGALGRNETAEAHIAVAVSYWRVGVLDAAFDHYSDALRLDPRNAVAWDGRARAWRQWGMIESALNDVHRAIYFGPREPEPLNTLGTILEAAGQCSEAREAYAGALKLDPSAEWARSNLDRLVCR